MSNKKKLERKTPSDIGGVCSGLGDYFDIDEVFVKIIFFTLIFTPFPIILTYFLLWIFMPKEPKY
jgi:phage shock protein PspC (stress-responsive transcriptional regulator)